MPEQMRNSTVDEVTSLIVKTLRIDGRAATLSASTPLFGSMPELDSMAVLELITALEGRFAVTIEPGEVTGEVFGTIGTLADFVDSKIAREARSG